MSLQGKFNWSQIASLTLLDFQNELFRRWAAEMEQNNLLGTDKKHMTQDLGSK